MSKKQRIAEVLVNEEGRTPICIWPCGTYCAKHHLEEYTHMSDDYVIVWLPVEFDEEDIDRWAHTFVA